MRKLCQNLRNAQLCRPKTGSLPAFLPSAAGQNSDTFPVLHTVERGVSLQGRGKIGGYPFRLAALRQATLPLLSLCDIFPRSGGSRPSRGRLLVVAIKFSVQPKGVPLGELAANAVSRLRGYLLRNRPRPLRLCSANPPLPKGEALAKR